MSEIEREGKYTKRKYDDIGDLMTVEDFCESVRSGMFNDFDGSGHAVKDGLMDMTDVYPSEIHRIPKDATHILWFNK